MKYFILYIFILLNNFTHAGETHAEKPIDSTTEKASPVDKNAERILFTKKNRRHVIEFIGTNGSGLAVIRQGNKWLLIFDHHFKFQLEKNEIISDLFDTINILEMPGNITVIELDLKTDVVFNVRKEAGNWAVHFSYKSLRELVDQSTVSAPLEIQEATWPNILVHNMHSNREIFITYEHMNLYVIPTKEIDDGLRLDYKTPFFYLEKTMQGFACRILSEHAFFERQNNYLSLGAKSVLPFHTDSSLKDKKFDHVVMARNAEDSGDYALELKKFVDIMNFFKAPYPVTLELNQAWLNCVAGDGAKVLSLFELLVRHYPGIIHNPSYKIIQAMGAISERRFEIAFSLMSLISDSQEFDLWRQICLSKLNEVVLLNPILTEAQRVILSYPKHLKRLMLEMILDIADEIDNRQALMSLSRSEFLPGDQNFYLLHQYYQGRIEQISGNQELAIAHFRLLLSNIKLVSLRPKLLTSAKLHVLCDEIEKREIKIQDGIQQLMSLHSGWRGDDLEYTILRKIIDFQIRAQDHFSVLKSLSQVKRLFPKLVVVDMVNEQMASIFYEYFSGDAQKLPPLQTIALYQRFRHLIPAGKEGENIVNSVVDKLVDLDLLDQAAELLIKAIAHREYGTEKHKMQLRSAQIHLLNKKYDDVLTILNDIPVQVAPEVRQQKILFMADAYMGKDMKKEALDILGGSTDPLHLRKAIDMLISDKNWERAVKFLEILVGMLDQATQMEEKKKAIQDLAISLYLSENYHSLRLLYSSHHELMKEDKIFLLLTRERDKLDQNFKSVSHQMRDFETLQKIVQSMESKKPETKAVAMAGG